MCKWKTRKEKREVQYDSGERFHCNFSREFHYSYDLTANHVVYYFPFAKRAKFDDQPTSCSSVKRKKESFAIIESMIRISKWISTFECCDSTHFNQLKLKPINRNRLYCSRTATVYIVIPFKWWNMIQFIIECCYHSNINWSNAAKNKARTYFYFRFDLNVTFYVKSTNFTI